jgi:hypothetical protein
MGLSALGSKIEEAVGGNTKIESTVEIRRGPCIM